jgi:energy-coupling factor transporter ATP-binding protein EcfA2
MRVLAADVVGPAVAFEAHGQNGRVWHAVGVEPSALARVRRILTDQVPGLVVGGEIVDRPVLDASGRVTVRLADIALDAKGGPAQATAILSALSAARKNEHLTLQLVLGPRLRPRRPDPAKKPRRSDAASQYGFQAVARIGITAGNSQRRQTLLLGLLSAIGTAASPGARFALTKEPTTRLQHAKAPWLWPLRLTVVEVPGLLAWPIGNHAPGLAAAHPRKLAPAVRTSNERVIAEIDAPGTTGPLGLSPRDGLQHLICLGPTGCGKSTLLTHLIGADITAGRPVVVVDPKRQLVDDVIDQMDPQRADDVVLMDLADERPPGFNPLDATGRAPDVVVDSVLAVLKDLWAEGWGPRTEQVITASLFTLVRAGLARSEPYTLLDVPRLLTDPAFRAQTRPAVADMESVTRFWAEFEAMKPGARAAMIAAPLNKFDQLTMRPALRRVLGQARPKFAVRDVFKTSKILLVPLNEALVGAGTAQLIGSLLVAEVWLAARERASEKNPMDRPGFVYVDEVQQYLHLPTSIDEALATSRSLGVGWNLAHQTRGQLTPALNAAIDANARNKIVFGVGPKDAGDIAKMTPLLEAEDFQLLDRFGAYAHLLVDGHSGGWCSITTLPPPDATGHGEAIRMRSREQYGANPTPLASTPAKPTPMPAQTVTVTPDPGLLVEPVAGRPGRRRRTS